MSSGELEAMVRRAAEAVAAADALLVGAGAGMGVDSGLPDFRGPEGFWRAYPPYRKLGLDFAAMANPRWFARDPAFAWGFYGHRLMLYRATKPHEGFSILRRWGAAMAHGAAVFTSNVDGQFERAGFDLQRIFEVHGSIHWMQCLQPCGAGLFAADAFQVDVDPETFRARGALPACPRCGSLARPNILMFGDWDWDEDRSRRQEARLEAWLQGVRGGRLVVVECGAGTAIPSVRSFCEQAARTAGATLIRINVREPQVPAGQIGLPLGALAALRAIDAVYSRP